MIRNNRLKLPLWKLSIFILCAALFDGLFSTFTASVLQIPLFLDTIGILTITFSFGGIPGIITALLSQFFCELFGNYLNFRIFMYVLCSFSAVGVICIFKNSLQQAKSKLSVIIILILISLLMCVVVSITGGLVDLIDNFFGEKVLGNIQTDYYKLALLKTKINDLGINILSRFPANILDRPISTFAGFGISRLLNKYLEK